MSADGDPVEFSTAVTTLLICLCFGTVAAIGLSVAGAGVPAQGDGSPVAGENSPLAQTDVEADTVTLRATLAADGTAAWRVAYRVQLTDENTSEAFADLRADVESNPDLYLGRFADRMNRTVRTAENATGRSMAVDNLSVSATRESYPQSEYGVLVYRLDWHGFATVDGDQLRAGDAIDRFFLGGQESLTVAWPGEYDVTSVQPDAASVEDASLTWQGRLDFGPGEPRVVLERGSSTGGGPPIILLAGGLAVLVVLVAAGVWLSTRRGGAVPDGDREGSDTGRAGSAGGTDDGPPPELLSNEERLLALLEDNGGRLKQTRVADELDWTAAKTSQVVGDLRDAGEVETFRLGRENVLTLPDVSLESDGERGDTDEPGDGTADGR